MVADVSSTTTTPNSNSNSKSKPLPPPAKPKRVPLLPSGTDNNGRSPQRPPKSKNVTSRYLSYTDTNSISTPNKRFPSHPRAIEMSASARMLTKTCVRSLSVSFQGESFALPVSKAGKPADNGLENGSPETKKKVVEKSHRIDKHKWPGRSCQGSFMTMSVDFTNEKVKLNSSKTTETKAEDNNLETAFASENSDQGVSDTESISSGSTVSNVRAAGCPRAIVVPARFWQETINLLRRVQPQPVPVAPVPLLKKNKPKISHEGPKLPPRGSSSNGGGCNYSNLGNTPSILSLCADSRRGKVGEKRIEDAHLLRLMHNKHVQWRFAIAKADAAMVLQRAAAQKSLYNAWVTISKLWYSIISKRQQIQQLKQNLKLHCLLKKQMLYLDDWDLINKDYSISLSGAIVALESSSLCLPVSSGAKVNIQNLKDAICSAVDVMQAMTLSLYSLVTKVENMNSWASELVKAKKTECSLLDQCKELLSTLTFLEKQDCSLRAHTLQLVPPSTTTQ